VNANTGAMSYASSIGSAATGTISTVATGIGSVATGVGSFVEDICGKNHQRKIHQLWVIAVVITMVGTTTPQQAVD